MTNILVLSLSFLLMIQHSFSQNAQSTTGPVPPVGTDITDHIIPCERSSVVVNGVPVWKWYRGCGPTAVGMVLAYYNNHGFSAIFPGSADSLTQPIRDRIASEDHYLSYILPADYHPNLLPDLSEPPPGDEHPDNCLADFMKTSQSAKNNYWGWSWSYDIVPAFRSYIEEFTPYYPDGETYHHTNFSWHILKNEIDNNYPLVFLVDTDEDGYSDHFITVVGYSESGGKQYYGCYHTWDTLLNWYEFLPIASGVSWGVHSAFTFRIDHLSGIGEKNDPTRVTFSPNPFTDQITVNNLTGDKALIVITDMQGREMIKTSSTSDQITIPTRNLPAGTYTARVINAVTGAESSRLLMKR